MSIALYMDENVRGQIVDGLRQRGVDVLTVVEDGREGISDPEVLDRATELQRLLHTGDDDLLREAHTRQGQGQAFVGVVYAHPLRVGIGTVIENLTLIGEYGEMAEFADNVVYLPL